VTPALWVVFAVACAGVGVGLVLVGRALRPRGRAPAPVEPHTVTVLPDHADPEAFWREVRTW
jgi:hypothetical protein